MGYRSEVVLALKYDDYLRGLNWMDHYKHEETNILLPKNVDKILKRKTSIGDIVLVINNSVKWNFWYEDVGLLYSFLRYINNDYGLLRVGEEYSDIEYEGDNTELLDHASVYAYAGIEMDSFYGEEENIENDKIGEIKKEHDYYTIYYKL
jgi:hypothetical protein